MVEDPEKEMLKRFLEKGSIEEGRDEEEEDEEEEEEEEPWINMPCYVFNPKFPPLKNDRRCRHCKKFLTVNCPHIDEMADDVDDMDPD